jgi:hypothetical protein
MFKLVAFLIRKPGISREDFKQRYETLLVPHMQKNFPIVKYTRNYIDPEVAIVVPGATLPPYDCVSEIYFKDKAGFETMMGKMSDPKVFADVDSIEKQFLDTSKTVLIKADESGDQ